MKLLLLVTSEDLDKSRIEKVVKDLHCQQKITKISCNMLSVLQLFSELVDDRVEINLDLWSTDNHIDFQTRYHNLDIAIAFVHTPISLTMLRVLNSLKNQEISLVEYHDDVVCYFQQPYKNIDTAIQKLQSDVHKWAHETFDRKESQILSGVLSHLKKEVDELINDSFDPFEYADCLILLLQAAKEAGISADYLVEKSFEKLEVNKKRDWGSINDEGFSEHC